MALCRVPAGTGALSPLPFFPGAVDWAREHHILQVAWCAGRAGNPLGIHKTFVDAGLCYTALAVVNKVDDPIRSRYCPGVREIRVLPSLGLGILPLPVGGGDFLMFALLGGRFGRGGGSDTAIATYRDRLWHWLSTPVLHKPAWEYSCRALAVGLPHHRVLDGWSFMPVGCWYKSVIPIHSFAHPHIKCTTKYPCFHHRP